MKSKPKGLSKYSQIIINTHKGISPIVPLLLMIREDLTDNMAFYIISYFFRFVGIYVRCGNFSVTEKQVKLNKTSTKLIRLITSYNLSKMLKINNKQYIIICFVLMGICLFRHLLYLLLYSKIKNRIDVYKIRPYRIQIVLDHLVIFFYAPIIEFLSLIYYIMWLSDTTFFLKRTSSDTINIIMCFVNAIFIIIYNIDGYFLTIASNKPLNTNPNSTIKFKYPKIKFWVLFIMQNFITLEALALFLKGMVLKVFKYFMLVFWLLLLGILYIASVNNYNYPCFINRYIETLGGFSFFSLSIELFCCLMDYNVTNYRTLIFMTLGKIMVACLFVFANQSITHRFVVGFCRKELFKINKDIRNDNIFDVFDFVYDLMWDIKKHGGTESINMLFNIIFNHQKECKESTCKCNLIHIIPTGKNYDQNFVDNLIERVSFLVESAFVQIDYSKSYGLTLLLSKHYASFKDNPIMAYSMAQTLLHFSYQKLSIEELLMLYDASQKFIKHSQELSIIMMSSLENTDSKLFSDKNKKVRFEDMFRILSKVKKIKKHMTKYGNNQVKIIKYKESVEESAKIDKNEYTQEIIDLRFTFLTRKNVENIFEILKEENFLYNEIIHSLKDLNSTKLPIEFHYKLFLFAETFWGGKILEELVPTFYGFTNDKNLYSSNINPSIYTVLKQRYIDQNLKKNSVFNAIFKYTKGMKIAYLSDPLTNRLRYKLKDAIGADCEVLLPRDIAYAHSNMTLKYLISDQNTVFPKVNFFLFDRFCQCIPAIADGASLPGISKDFKVILRITLNELPNKYFFIFNKNYKMISVSETFYKSYGLSLSLIEKFKISIFDLFGIDRDTFKTNFQRYFPSIIEMKNILEIMTNEYYTKKLFRQSSGSSKANYARFKLLDDLEKHYKRDTNDNEEISEKESLMKAQNRIETIYSHKLNSKMKFHIGKDKILKKNVIQNFDNIIDTIQEVDIHDEDYKFLSDVILRFRTHGQYLTPFCIGSKKNTEDFFLIESKMSVLYDTQFFKLEVTEVSNKMVTLVKSSLDGYSNSVQQPSLVSNSDIKKKETKKIKFNENSPQFATNKCSPPDTISSKGISLNHNDLSKELSLLQEISNKNRINNFKFIQLMVFLLVIILLIIYILLIKYQEQNISVYYLLSKNMLFLYYQKAKLLNIYTVFQSSYLRLMQIIGYPDITVGFDIYSDLFELYGSQYADGYHKFYMTFDELCEKTGKNLDVLYEKKEAGKIAVVILENKYITDYTTESKYLTFMTRMLSKASKSQNSTVLIRMLYHDANVYFNLHKNPTELEKDPMIVSYYMQVYYYFCRNYMAVLRGMLKNIQTFSENIFFDYKKESKIKYTTLESLGLLLSITLFSFALYYLYVTNKKTFMNILNLFIDFTREGAYSFKNKVDNFILIKKISLFDVLLQDFTLKNLSLYNQRLSGGGNLPQTLTVTNNQDDLSPEGSSEHQKIQNFKRDYSILNKVKTQEKIFELRNGKKKVVNDKNKGNKGMKRMNSIQRNNLLSNSNNLNSLNNNMSSSNVVLIGEGEETPSNKSKFNELNKIRGTKRDRNSLNSNLVKIEDKYGGINNEPKKDEADMEGVLTVEIIEKKTKTILIRTIMVYMIILIILLIIVVPYYILKLIISYGFTEEILVDYQDFAITVSEIGYLFNFYTSLITAIISDRFKFTDELDQITKVINAEFSGMNDFINKRMDSYLYIKSFYHELNPSNNDTKVDINKLICENQDAKYIIKDNATIDRIKYYCSYIVSSRYNLFKEGYSAGVNAIFQNIINIYKDFKKLPESTLLDKENIRKYFNNSELWQVDLNLNFVVSILHDIIFNLFFLDQNRIQDSFKNKISSLNSCAIAYFVFTGFFIIIFILYPIRAKAEIVEHATRRMNRAFLFIRESNLGNRASSLSMTTS